MVHKTQNPPHDSVSHEDTWVQPAVAIGSLTLLVLGLVGLATAHPGVSATGLFLYALIGFGAAALMALGYRGWNLLTLSPPVGLASVLLVGVLLATTGTWAIGPALFWALVCVTASMHLAVVAKTLIAARSRHTATHGNQYSEGDESEVSTEPDHRVLKRPQPLTLMAGISTALGLILCLASALAIRHLNPGWGGLLGAISPAWYVGLALLATAILVGQRLGNVYAGLPVLALQLALTGTSAIVFDDPRFAWTAKQVGVTSYILLHGSVNSRIDIYQAWPGFFSGVAWLCKVSTLANPMGVARWWPPIIDLATLLVFHQLASRVLRDPRRAWLAATLLVVGYTINDSDYFSPQSTAYLLAIAIFAVVYQHRGDKSRMTSASWVLLFTMSTAVALTHQLTPYIVTGALAVLVLFDQARTRWAALITIAPTVAWALLHFSYVAKYFSFSEIGNILRNLLTPGLAGGGPSQGMLVVVSKYVQGGASLLIGSIAVAALVRDRSRLHLVIALCAASGGALIFANSYGNEAIFRVVLFALPWLAILASEFHPVSRLGSTFFWPFAVFILLSGYLVADMGLDFVYAQRPGDLIAIQAFERSAPAGSTLIVIGDRGSYPSNLTGRYNLVNEESYPNVRGSAISSTFNAAVSYSQFMSELLTTRSLIPSQLADNSPSYYVLTAEQPAAYLAAYNYSSLEQYRAFSAQFSGSSQWRLVLRTPTAELFRLRTSQYDSLQL